MDPGYGFNGRGLWSHPIESDIALLQGLASDYETVLGFRVVSRLVLEKERVKVDVDRVHAGLRLSL